MKRIIRRWGRDVILLFSVALPLTLNSATGAVLYKRYVVRHDRGHEILCDPYIVHKDEWVYKIFRQKGEISSRNYQEFLGIFKRLNPHVHDIDLIRPNQQILIPLKKLAPGTFPSQHTGVVTIPFVTIAKIPELINAHAHTYTVQKGDSVSQLIWRRFGPYGTKSYRQGLAMFKAVNPQIVDINFIYTGQEIILPDSTIQNESWYESLFDAKGHIKQRFEPGAAVIAQADSNVTQRYQKEDADPISDLADVLDAKLLNKGTYFFPSSGGTDVELNLATHPVIELKDGTRIVFSEAPGKDADGLSRLSAFWPKMHIVSLSDSTSLEKTLQALTTPSENQSAAGSVSFSDQGLEATVRAQWIKTANDPQTGMQRHRCLTLIDGAEQRTHPAIVRYLDQQGIVLKEIINDLSTQASRKRASHDKAPFSGNVMTLAPVEHPSQFVEALVTAIGFQYAANVPISFPYAGVQVKAYSNLVTTPNQKEVLVDFGDLYGEAIQEIEKTGLNIIQLLPQDDTAQCIQKLLRALKIPFVENPSFLAAQRGPRFNTELKTKGYLINDGGREMLLSSIPLSNQVLTFLSARRVKVILTGLIQR